jgi:hypothetical protein
METAAAVALAPPESASWAAAAGKKLRVKEEAAAEGAGAGATSSRRRKGRSSGAGISPPIEQPNLRDSNADHQLQNSKSSASLLLGRHCRLDLQRGREMEEGKGHEVDRKKTRVKTVPVFGSLLSLAAGELLTGRSKSQMGFTHPVVEMLGSPAPVPTCRRRVVSALRGSPPPSYTAAA